MTRSIVFYSSGHGVGHATRPIEFVNAPRVLSISQSVANQTAILCTSRAQFVAYDVRVGAPSLCRHGDQALNKAGFIIAIGIGSASRRNRN